MIQGYRLRCELIAPVSVQEAFEIFENPYNLARITPPWLHFQILTRDLKMHLGAEIDYRFRWLGVPLNWRTVITEYEPPFLFVDEALRSPYLYWRHRHVFRPMEQGTAVLDRVEYALPWGPVGRAVHRFVVAEQLRRIFRFRQEEIARMLGGARMVLNPVVELDSRESL